MKRFVLSVALVAQPFVWEIQPIRAGVYAWSALKETATNGGVTRPILTGVSTDLSYLEVHATTIPNGNSAASTFAHDTTELLMIIKDGSLKVAVGGKSKVMGPGSVAIALPGEALEVSNAGASEATYYLFTYKARTPVDMERGKKAGGSVLLDWNDVPKNPNATGFNRPSLDRPTAMFRRFEMHVSTVGAGLTNHAPHTHFAEEFVLLREGNVSMFIDGKVIPAAKGDLVFLASNVPHSLNNGKETTTEYFAFQGQAR